MGREAKYSRMSKLNCLNSKDCIEQGEWIFLHLRGNFFFPLNIFCANGVQTIKTFSDQTIMN